MGQRSSKEKQTTAATLSTPHWRPPWRRPRVQNDNSRYASTPDLLEDSSAARPKVTRPPRPPSPDRRRFSDAIPPARPPPPANTAKRLPGSRFPAISMPNVSLELLASCGTKTIDGTRAVPEFRACPGCGTLIDQEGGKHIKCAMCAYEFCFVCLKTKDAAGRWQCSSGCTVAARQTTVPRSSYTEDTQDRRMAFVDMQLDNNERLQDDDNRSAAEEIMDASSAAGGLQPLAGEIEVSYEPCCVTYDDDVTVKRARMPCGHVIGVDAMKQLYDTTISNKDSVFACPGTGCQTVWDFHLVRHVLSVIMTADELNQASTVVGQNYILRHDIRACPKCLIYCTKGQGAGNGRNENRVICQICTKRNNGEAVSFCWRCVRPWSDDDLAACKFCDGSDADRLRQLAECPTKKIGSVDGCPEIRACPSCGLLIYHIDKCNHMSCPMCKCSFCFICLKQEKDGNYCAAYSTFCQVAPRQTKLPGSTAPEIIR